MPKAIDSYGRYYAKREGWSSRDVRDYNRARRAAKKNEPWLWTIAGAFILWGLNLFQKKDPVQGATRVGFVPKPVLRVARNVAEENIEDIFEAAKEGGGRAVAAEVYEDYQVSKHPLRSMQEIHRSQKEHRQEERHPENAPPSQWAAKQVTRLIPIGRAKRGR